MSSFRIVALLIALPVQFASVASVANAAEASYATRSQKAAHTQLQNVLASASASGFGGPSFAGILGQNKATIMQLLDGKKAAIDQYGMGNSGRIPRRAAMA